MRGRLFNMAAIGRAAGFAAVAVAIVAAAVHVHRAGGSHAAATSLAPAQADPLAAALARCQALGMAAEREAACQAAWAQNRRRFFNDNPRAGARE